MDTFPTAGLLRRIRRLADCSQREPSERIGASKATVAAAESGTRDLPVSLLARAAAVAGGRLAVLDAAGAELAPMDPGAVRDAADRLFPAHLDTRHGDERWWGGEHRPHTRQPRYTFDRDRHLRDLGRHEGAAADHHLPAPGDSLTERAAARRREASRRVAEQRRQATLGRPRPQLPDPFTCTCPPGCDDPDVIDRRFPHTDECACRCDLD